MSYKNSNKVVILLVFLCAPLSLVAQDAKPQRPSAVYRVDYTFSELQNDKRVNARSYSLLVRASERGSIRLGDRLPIMTSTKEGNAQFQYLDVGVNIDARVEDSDVPDVGSSVDLFTSIDVSNLAPDQSTDNRTGSPIVRQTKFQNENIVPLGKQVLLSSADEVGGTRRFQIEVMATKVK